MKRIAIAMLLMLAGCQLAAAACYDPRPCRATDDQVKCDKSKLLKDGLIKEMAKHVGVGNITVANDDERTLCVCFYSSGEDLLTLLFLAVALLG